MNVGVLDVDGFGGLFVGRGQAAVDGREDLQDAFGQAGLKHHAATADAHVLAARIQVGDAHRHFRQGRKAGRSERVLETKQS